MVSIYILTSLLSAKRLVSRFALLVLRRGLVPLTVLLAACGGGGEGSGPAQWPNQTISGVVVNAGSAVANAQVYLYCQSGTSGAYLVFYTTSDSNGAYSKSANNAVAPCVVYAQVGRSTTLYSYVKSFAGGTATAHITPASDAMLSVMMGLDYRSIFQSDTVNQLVKLGTKLSAGGDTAAWAAMRGKLLTGDEFTDPTDVNAMVGDPVSGTLQVTGGTPPAGYYGLLKNLAANHLDNYWLWAYTSGQAQKIAGNVVANGVALGNTQVHLSCMAGNHINSYYVNTDSNGFYSALVNKTNTLCLIDAYDPVIDDYWFGYSKVSGTDSTATAHITALTDTLFSLLLNTTEPGTMINANGLAMLQSQLDQGKDVSLWSTFRQNMITGPHFTDADDVNAMTGDPVTGTLQTTTADPPPAGYFSLLKKLGTRTRAELRAIATDP